MSLVEERNIDTQKENAFENIIKDITELNLHYNNN